MEQNKFTEVLRKSNQSARLSIHHINKVIITILLFFELDYLFPHAMGCNFGTREVKNWSPRLHIQKAINNQNHSQRPIKQIMHFHMYRVKISCTKEGTFH